MRFAKWYSFCISTLDPHLIKKKKMIPTQKIKTKVEEVVETIYWEGGTPGKETCWMEPSNWSGGKVPGLLSSVHVGVKTFAPIIENGEFRVSSIEVDSKAVLTIKEGGFLKINGMMDFSNGIKLKGTLINYGKIQIIASALAYILIDKDGLFHNFGIFGTDRSKRDSIFIVRGGKLKEEGTYKVI